MKLRHSLLVALVLTAPLALLARADGEGLPAGPTASLANPTDLSRLYSLLRVWMPALERI